MDASHDGDRIGQPGNLAGSAKPPSAADQPSVGDQLSIAAQAGSASAACSEDATAPVATGWDHALAAAMHDVPLPAGLSARLLAQLPEPAIAVERRAAGRRRWLRVATASLACAASVTVAILFLNQTAPDMGSESVMDSVRAWHKQQAAVGHDGGWGPLHHEAPPEDYRPGSLVMPGCVEGWRLLTAPLLGRAGVAYELVGPRQNRATLYVLDFDGPRSAPRLLLNTTSPLENLLTTDGQTSSAWTDGVRLYVLVADGDEQDFRTLVRAPRSMA